MRNEPQIHWAARGKSGAWPPAIRRKACLFVVVLFCSSLLFILLLEIRSKLLAVKTPARSTGIPKIQELVPEPEEREIAGEWNRIEFPDAVIRINWRKFSKGGKMAVRYGDLIMEGTYRILDHQTIETSDRNGGTVERWKIGFTQGTLVMINQQEGWVEKYCQVPDGTIKW